MDLQVFLDLNNDNTEKRQESVDKIMNSISDPSFFEFILELIENNINEKNEQLMKVLLVVLVEISRKKVDLVISMLNNELIRNRILWLQLNMAKEYRNFIEEVFLAAANANTEKFEEIVVYLLNSISDATPINEIASIVSLLSEWSKSSSLSAVAEVFHSHILSIIHACISLTVINEDSCDLLGYIASILKELTNRRVFLLDNVLLESMLALSRVCTYDSAEIYVMHMKVCVIDLFSSMILNVFQKWKNENELQVWRECFSVEVLPSILSTSVEITKTPIDSKLGDSLFMLYYRFICFDIESDVFINEEFFENIVIPAAKLTNNDIADFVDNPSSYIAFCFDGSNEEHYTSRICAYHFVELSTKNYIHIFDPINLLMSHNDDMTDFEAKVFLLQSYVSVCPVDPEIIEVYSNLLTQDIPPQLVVSLMRLLSMLMSHSDPISGISISTHFITNSDSYVIQYAASIFLDECLKDIGEGLDEIGELLELPYNDLFTVLLHLSNELHLELPTILMEKIFKIGGSAFTEFALELVKKLMLMWSSNQESGGDIEELTAVAQMDSIVTILETMPPDSQMLKEFSSQMLQFLIDGIAKFPQSHSTPSQIRAGSVFSMKLSDPTQELFDFIDKVLSTPEVILESSMFLDSISLLVCPLISNPQSHFFTYSNGELLNKVSHIIGKSLDLSEDPDTISLSLFMASCLIQSGGYNIIELIPKTIDIVNNKKQSTVLFGAFYLIGSACLINIDVVKSLVNNETMCMMTEKITNRVPLSYRELKYAIISLCFFSQLGCQISLTESAMLIKELLEMAEFEDSLKERGIYRNSQYERVLNEEQLLSIAPLISLPLDSYDEIELFSQLMEKSTFFDINDPPKHQNRKKHK